MLTTAHVTADLAADRTHTLLAEAETYRLGRAARRTREAWHPRWGWPRSRARAALVVVCEPT